MNALRSKTVGQFSSSLLSQRPEGSRCEWEEETIRKCVGRRPMNGRPHTFYHKENLSVISCMRLRVNPPNESVMVDWLTESRSLVNHFMLTVNGWPRVREKRRKLHAGDNELTLRCAIQRDLRRMTIIHWTSLFISFSLKKCCYGKVMNHPPVSRRLWFRTNSISKENLSVGLWITSRLKIQETFLYQHDDYDFLPDCRFVCDREGISRNHPSAMRIRPLTHLSLWSGESQGLSFRNLCPLTHRLVYSKRPSACESIRTDFYFLVDGWTNWPSTSMISWPPPC